MRSVGCQLLLIVSATLVWGQNAPVTEIHSVPDAYRGQTVVSWRRGPPTFELIPQTAGGRSGHVWVASSPDGLLIQGEVAGPKPSWPATRSDMLRKDHIEVWLAAEPKMDLPPIGWGSQFGEQYLESENDCSTGNRQPEFKADACKAWFREQVKYREQFRRLFVRQWLLAGDDHAGYPTSYIVEEYSHAAMQNITTNFFPAVYDPTAIGPAFMDGVMMWVSQTVRDQPGYSFQITIPYSAFPPVPSLDVRDLWLMVDVFGAAPEGKRMGAFSTTAPHRKWGDPSTFNHVRIEHPLQLSLSPCAYPLAQQNLYDKDQPSFVYPVPEGTKEGERVLIDKAVVVLNPAQGYLYDPAGASPQAQVRRVFFKPTGNGGFVCGPKLAYVKGPISVKTANFISEEGFDTKLLADGWILVKSGPDAGTATRFGAGPCGACYVAELNIYAISPRGEVKPALQIDEVIGNRTNSADFDFSHDWSRATYYSQAEYAGSWTAKTYCLKGHDYEACGSKENATPPDPPGVKVLRGSQ